MNRAFGVLEIRSVDDEQRIFEGIANSASIDSYGTIIDPGGAVFRLPIPLFWHHDRKQPIGDVIATWIHEGKRWVRGIVPRIADDGTEGGRDVMRRVDAAWTEMKHGLVRGLSIEFTPIEPKSPNAKRWTKWQWLGLGVVPVASNQDATILTIRAAVEATLAAQSPAVAGTSHPSVLGNGSTVPRTKMTLLEQIQQHTNSRAAKVARQQTLMDGAETRGETLAANEAEEYDTLTREVEAIDDHLVRLNTLKRANAAAAVAVTTIPTPAAGSQNRGGVPVVRTRENTEPGIGVARYVMALLTCNGNRYEAAEYAKRTWGDGAEDIAVMLRSAVAAGTTQNSTWAAPLVATNYMNELLELLRPATIIGRIPGLKRVPFNVSMPVQTAGGTYGWVGEGKPKPVTNMQFSAVTLGMAVAAGIIVLTKQLVKSSSPAAQGVVRDEMVAGIAQFLDVQFTDPAVAAVANVSPASITNGVTGFAATGTAEANIRADLRKLIKSFSTANLNIGGVVLLMNEDVAFTIGTAVNAVGEPSFPMVNPTGGNILTVPIVTSNAVGAQIIALHAPSVMLADDGQTEVDISDQASLQMDSAPEAGEYDETVLVSLWQRNLIGLRAERYINWGKSRANAVNRITSVGYL